jgi:hypothetical protein
MKKVSSVSGGKELEERCGGSIREMMKPRIELNLNGRSGPLMGFVL